MSLASRKLAVHKNNDNNNNPYMSSSVEDKLLIKFHSILNSYNNESHQSTETSKSEKKIIQTLIKRPVK